MGIEAVVGISAGDMKELNMAWTTPQIEEICIGMEINAYFSAIL